MPVCRVGAEEYIFSARINPDYTPCITETIPSVTAVTIPNNFKFSVRIRNSDRKSEIHPTIEFPIPDLVGKHINFIFDKILLLNAPLHLGAFTNQKTNHTTEFLIPNYPILDGLYINLTQFWFCHFSESTGFRNKNALKNFQAGIAPRSLKPRKTDSS